MDVAAHTAHIIARSIFHDSDDNNNSSSSKHVCPTEDTAVRSEPVVGNLTFQKLASILTGAAGIYSILVAIFIISRHSMHYSNPVQQRQIVRIILLVPWIAFFAWLITFKEEAGEYLVESLDFGTAIALSSFLLLLCDFILQQEGGFDDLFGEGAWKRGQFSKESPSWLKRTWYSVLQFIPVSLIIWIATCITVAAGIYCAQSNSIHFAHIWITVFKSFFTAVAIMAIFRFYGNMKAKLTPHNVFLKFFAFKGIIGLNVLQTLIINILVGTSAVKPTSTLSYNDIAVAMPALLLGLEMPIFVTIMIFAFPTTPYQNRPKVKGANFFVVVGQALNITDLASCFIRGPMRLLREQSRVMIRQDSIALMQNGSNDSEYRPHGGNQEQGMYQAPGQAYQPQGYAGQMA